MIIHDYVEFDFWSFPARLKSLTITANYWKGRFLPEILPKSVTNIDVFGCIGEYEIPDSVSHLSAGCVNGKTPPNVKHLIITNTHKPINYIGSGVTHLTVNDSVYGDLDLPENVKYLMLKSDVKGKVNMPGVTHLITYGDIYMGSKLVCIKHRDKVYRNQEIDQFRT
jgi:hypothetical protein